MGPARKPSDYSLGHYVGNQIELGGVIGWYNRNRQPLPARPENGSEVHRIECETCHQPLDLKVMSQARAINRKIIKFAAGLFLFVEAISLLVMLDQMRPDPETLQYPAWTDWMVLPLSLLWFGGAALIGLGFYERGVKISIPPGSRARKGWRSHRILSGRR